MNEEVLQAAAQTFCLVPEVYAQAFKQAGADFPDELVAQIKKQPEQAMQMLKEDQELFKGVVTIYSQYKDQIDQAAAQAAQQTRLFREGGKLKFLIEKHQNGGAIRFYRDWSENDIRKLQTFLAGQGFDPGDLDGKMGNRTISAVKAYQKAHKVQDDGKWGYNTNQIQRALSTDILNKGHYKASHKTEQGDLVKKINFNTAIVKDVDPKDFQDMLIYYQGNPVEFFDTNNETSNNWRQVLANSGKDGEFFINQMYGLLSPEERKRVDNRSKSDTIKTDEIIDKEHKGQAEALKQLGLFTGGVAGATMLPIGLFGGAAMPTVLGTGSGMFGNLLGVGIGDWAGGKIGRTKNNRKNEFGFTTVYNDPVAERYGVGTATYDPRRTIRESIDRGRAIGGTIGTVLGTAAGSGLGAIAESEVQNIYNMGHANLNYKVPVNEDYGYMNLFGHSTGKPVGKSYWSVFKAGLKGNPQGDGKIRLGGRHGRKFSFNGKQYNPGSYANDAAISAAKEQFVNKFAPVVERFGGQPNLGIGSKLGYSYEVNPLGIAVNTALTSPAAGEWGVIELKKYQ